LSSLVGLDFHKSSLKSAGYRCSKVSKDLGIVKINNDNRIDRFPLSLMGFADSQKQEISVDFRAS
jgi:hypothetical protein